MAQAVEFGVMRDRGFPAGAGGDRGQQRPRANVVGGLARRQEHPDRTALCIRQDVQFRVQTALGPPDQPSAPPF